MAFPPVPFQEWFLRQTSTGNAALNAYVARVKADGGVVEAIGCVPLAVWDWVAPVAPSFVGLLDLYPNAAAAYSLRKLRAAYSGAAVRVRESGGNTEADIGFDANGDLDTSALLAHCGANDGFVTVWYDQSLSNDATQSTAANQPKIVNAGSLVTENSKAAIDFDGVDDEFNVSVGITTGFAVFGVYKNTKANSYIIGDNPELGRRSNNQYRFRDSIGFSAGANGGTHSNNQVLIEGLEDGANARVYANGVEQAFTASTFTSVTIDAISKNYVDGTMQELIVFNSDQSANRTGIETNINNFYSTY